MDNTFEANIELLEMGVLNPSQICAVQKSFFTLTTDYIDTNRPRVAQTFESLLEQIQKRFLEIDEIPIDILNDIYLIFKNIEHIHINADEEEKTDGSIILLRFLAFLRQHNSIDGDNNFSNIGEIRDILGIVAENLEQIQFVFDYKISDKLVFPIDKLLVGVIKDSHFLSQIKKFDPRDYYALKLAVRFFKKGSEGNILIDEIKNESNLRFIDYLNQDCILIDTKGMLNYQKNGVMVFWNSQTKKVLVRSNNDDYFDKNSIISGERSYEIEHELTKDGKVRIGSFIEFCRDESDHTVSVDDLMKTPTDRVKVLKLFFTEGRNIFLPNALIEAADGTLTSVNPFVSHDQYVIKENEKSIISVDVKGALSEYTNLALMVSHRDICNRVTVGTFALLADINSNLWESLLEPYDEGEFYQNQMVRRWMVETTDPESIGQLLRALYDELRYCGNTFQEIRDYAIKRQHFYPLQADIKEYIVVLGENFDKTAVVVEGVVTEVDGDPTIHIKGEKVIMSPERIVDSENILDMLENRKVYCISCNGQLYVLNQEMLKALYGLKDVFPQCLSFAAASKITHTQYDDLKKAMLLHKDALVAGAEKAFSLQVDCFDDQVYYRLIHNLVAYGIDANKVGTYFDIIRAHDKLIFNEIKSDPYFKMEEEGVLYVPKDNYSTDSALSSVNDRYIKRKSMRDAVSLYEPRLEYRREEYWRYGHKISKIVFLVDNFESGSGTINSLAAYLEINPTTDMQKAVEKTKARIQRYYYSVSDKEKFVSIDEILKKNKCIVEVHAFYGTDEASQKIDAYLDNNGIKHEPTSFMRFIQCKVEAIKEDVLKIWPGCKVKTDKYAVIREFNMTKINVFPDEMLSDAGKAITLFVKKAEIDFFRAENDEKLMQRMEAVLDYLLHNKQTMTIVDNTLTDKLTALYEQSGNKWCLVLQQKIKEKKLNQEWAKDVEEITDAVIEMTIEGLVKYFNENKIGENKKVNTALYLVSTLPPWIRIRIWQLVARIDHSYIVLEKMVKAYAKNGQMDLVEVQLREWVNKGYVSEEKAVELREQAVLLLTYKDKLPIAEDIKKAKQNYATALQIVDRRTDVDEMFLALMDLINSL